MSEPIVKQVADVDGARIEYLEAGAGTTLVFFHGAGGVSASPAFIPALAKRYRVLLPSRPGFDGSSGSTATGRDVAEVMSRFVHAVGGGPVHLIGESAGGAPACWLAVLHPELVESLVLAAPAVLHRRPSLEPDASHGPAGVGSPDLGSSPEQGDGPSSDALDEVLFGASPAWSAPPSAAEVAQRQRNAAYHRAHWDAVDEELERRLTEIEAPTLVLWGTADRLLPPEEGEWYQRAIPRSHLVYLYGAAHSLPVAVADRFVRLVTEFIEQGEAFVVNQRATSEESR